MMGSSHAVIGGTVWLAVVPLVDATTGLTGGQVALGTVLAAGGSMAPDFDQPGSTLARCYGPVTNVVARLVSLLSGGHRQGTHSLVGVAAFVALAWWCHQVGGWAFGLLLWVLLGVAARALNIAVPGHRSATAVIHAVTMAPVAALVATSGIDTAVVVPWAAGIGYGSHIAADMLTDRGCPLAWPVWSARFGVPVCTTDGWVEPMIRRVTLAVGVGLAAGMTATGQALWTSVTA